MKKSEVVPIAYTGDLSKEASSTPERRLDADGLGDASQVRAIKAGGEQAGSCKDNGRDHSSGIGVVRPVGCIERGCPFGLFLSVFITFIC